jgi:hypothetical protein
MILWIIFIVLWVISAIGTIVGNIVDSTHPVTMVCHISMWIFVCLQWVYVGVMI